MSNGIINFPVLLTHPLAPAPGRVLRYVFDSGTETEPFYMLEDGVPRSLQGIDDHLSLSNIGTNSHDDIDNHIAATNNPHSVTKAQVGLANAENTSDLNKPISTATQSALDLKQDILTYFRWILQAGNSNLSGNGTESNFSYGNNSGNDGITAINDGEIEGMSVRFENARTSGSQTFIVTINSVQNNVVGQRVVINGSVGVEGEFDDNSGALLFSPPLSYSQGDQIEVRAIGSGFNPTSADSTVLLRMKEDLL